MRTEGKGVFEAGGEAIEIGRRAHVPVEIIHLKIAEHTLWGQMPELVASIAAARGAGRGRHGERVPVPRRAEQPVGHHAAMGAGGGPEAMIARLKDAKLRPRLRSEILHGIPGSNWYDHYTATGGWEGMLLVSFPTRSTSSSKASA